MQAPPPEQARMLAALAGFELADDELPAFGRQLARVLTGADSLRRLDYDGVLPWTPQS